MQNLLRLKNDFVFKKLFGEEGCEDILKPFLEVILKEKIEDLVITRDRELLKNIENDKTGIIDVKATFDNKTKVNIELQVGNRYNMSKRTFFYLAKLYPEGLTKGSDYTKLLKTISINIIGYNEFEKDHCHSIFRLKDEDNSDAYYKDVMEIHFLELKKVAIDHMEDETLLDWLKFIKADNDEVVKTLSEKNKDIYKAKEKLEELSSDEEIRSIAENRAKYLSDYATDTRGYYEDGLKDGIINEKRETIYKFLKRLNLQDETLQNLLSALESIQDLDELTKLEDLFFDGKNEEAIRLLKAWVTL